jgi:multiple sugar transport system ATP-binding protein
MKDGSVQQINTPEHLYNKPCNLFVAGFIGSPQMNFLDAVVEIKGNDAFLHIGDDVLKMPADKAKILKDGGYDGKTVVFGIRPEHFGDGRGQEGKQNTLKCKVEVRELLGAEVFLYGDINGKQCTARVDPEVDLVNGMEATYSVDMRKIQLFDKETEKSLLWAV